MPHMYSSPSDVTAAECEWPAPIDTTFLPVTYTRH